MTPDPINNEDHRKRSTYLGDGAYAMLDEYGATWLYTTNGKRVTNAVCLEPQVLWAFDKWRGDRATEVTDG